MRLSEHESLKRPTRLLQSTVSLQNKNQTEIHDPSLTLTLSLVLLSSLSFFSLLSLFSLFSLSLTGMNALRKINNFLIHCSTS